MRVLLFLLFFTTFLRAEHLILAGGPALLSWENMRVERDRHDRFWGNFIRASTIRIDNLRRAYGPEAKVTWIVYRPGYEMRGRQDGKPYPKWIEGQASKRKVRLIWVNSGPGAIAAMNSLPTGSVKTFDFIGHSNRHAFMLDYGTEIMAVSKAWIHERDLGKIRSAIFAPNALCQSYGCHTGESMSQVWRSRVGNTLIGARGKTDFRSITTGKMPWVNGSWVR